MDYLTGIASSPIYEFPYSGYQAPSISFPNDDINAILAVCTILSINQIKINSYLTEYYITIR